MARMIINGTITNLTIVLLAFLVALGALFPTDVQATNSPSEQSRECESKFWFKNLSHFKQSIKTKCLKENRHHKEHKEMKRHQSHVCNNKSHDKKALLRRWQKFSNCRCESAMGDFKGFFVCYQIVQLNKVTGEFLGELSLYKKEGQHLKVGLKFSHKVEVLNDDQWRRHQGFYLSKKGPRFVEKRNRFLLQKYFVLGKISKNESMNKITLDKISPSKYLLILGNGKSRTVKPLSTKNEKVATIPFSRFIHNGLKTIILKNHQNEVPEKDDDNKNAKKPTEDVDKKKPVNNEDKKNKPADDGKKPADDGKKPADDGKKPADDGKNPADDGKKPADDGKKPADDGKDPADDGKKPADDGKNPADDGKKPTEGANEKEENEEPNPDQDPSVESPNPDNENEESEYEPDKGSDGDQPKTGNADEKDGSQDNPEELNKGKDEKDEKDKKVPSGKESLMRAGVLIVGCVVAVGSIFVAFNTYERRRLRKMQRNFVHNPSLANVPDYNGYGRAH